MKVLVIDESKCPEALNEFVQKNKSGILANFHSDDWGLSMNKLPKRLVINKADSILFLSVNEIMRIESVRNYSQVHMTDGSKIMLSKALVEMESKLKYHHFIRVHKSHLVNSECIIKFIKGGSGKILLTDNTSLPVSPRRKNKLVSFMRKC